MLEELINTKIEGLIAAIIPLLYSIEHFQGLILSWPPPSLL
jgi:hypothetical protein